MSCKLQILLWLFAQLAVAGPRVDYRLQFPNAVHHEAEITATFSGVTQPVLEVVMSRSSPGRYALHEFAKNVYRVRATDNEGKALTVVRPDPYGWNISGHHGTVVMHYTLFGDRADGTYDGMDETHAHLNLPATLLWAHGFEHAPASLALELPTGSGWRVATQLVPQKDGTWSAPNLAQLMDSPVELSAHTLLEWQAADGQIFQVALHHRGSLDEAKTYAEQSQALTLEAGGVFGGFPKFDNGSYTFLTDYLPYVYGDGMEHRDSASISGALDLKDVGNTALDTVAHEFFHAWNVRRIRPRSLEPFDLERTNMSGELWFAEGFTSYYGPLLMKRAGFSSLDDFASDMSNILNVVINSPGRETFSVVEMSRMAPLVDAARSVDATNFRNTFISYYTYGAALALGIDLAIRERFPQKSLDDWMRVMWRRHADIDRTYSLADLESALAEATGDPPFARTIFQRYVEGRDLPDYKTLLAGAGFVLQKLQPGKPWVGLGGTRTTDGGMELTEQTLRTSPLYSAGLEQGDEIYRCDERIVKKLQDFTNCLAKHSIGDTLTLEYLSRVGNKRVIVTVAEDPEMEVIPYEKKGLRAGTDVISLREHWLGSHAISKKTQVVFR